MTYLDETYFFDYSHPRIQQYVDDHTSKEDSLQEKSVKLHNAIRDGWRYNPYQIRFKREEWQSSCIMERPEGHCLDKSILYVSCLRAVGIPARLHLAKVRNHIAAEKLMALLGTDELTPHGMVDLMLDGKWLKASPAFNKSLCDKLNVDTLEFDGRTDSVFQEFDKEGGLFMEYLEDYGGFEDFPFDFVIDNMKAHYSGLTDDNIPEDGLLEIK